MDDCANMQDSMLLHTASGKLERDAGLIKGRVTWFRKSTSTVYLRVKKSLPRLMTQCIAALQHCNNDYYWLWMSFPALFIALTWQLASAHLCMFVLSPGKSIRFLVSKHCLKWSMTYCSLLAQMWSCLYSSQGLIAWYENAILYSPHSQFAAALVAITVAGILNRCL